MEMNNIKIGQSYTLTATANTPETAVTVVAINGRWVKVEADFNGALMNVGAARLIDNLTHFEDSITEAYATDTEVEEMMEAPAAPSMISTLVNFRSQPTPVLIVPDFDEKAARKNGIVKAEYLQGYQKVKVQRADGEILRTFDKGDQVAISLRGMTLEQVYCVASHTIGVPASDLQAKYQHLNFGQQRMCVGNVIRGYLKKIAEA